MIVSENSSYKDPQGYVFYKDGRVFRRVLNNYDEIKYILNLINSRISLSKYIINSKLLTNNDLLDFFHKKIGNGVYIEHESLSYISYPYEWSFNRLKDSAIHHLKFHIELLNNGLTLKDASAYNVQFKFHKPIFIDLLSIKKYQEGEFWYGMKQFCEEFLNPLILKSICKIDYNNWYKGNLSGINTSELKKTLGIKNFKSWNIFYNVFMLDYFERKNFTKRINVKNQLKKKYYLALLKNLLTFITNLKNDEAITTWSNYSKKNTYKQEDNNKKKLVVQNFIKKYNIQNLLDLGCNDGEYSFASLNSGCKSVIGLDLDLNAVDEGFLKSKSKNANFMPLYFDATNPSPSLGWLELERTSLKKRFKFDGLIALAFQHHLTLGKNIPITQFIDWVISFADKGIIEFVPKSDITVKNMLLLKGDIFPDYNLKKFLKILSNKVQIINMIEINKMGRVLIIYDKAQKN